MSAKHQKEIWTIGHSTRTLEHFVEMLHSFNITLLADIRSFPGSRRVPQFNKENLEISMPANGIDYVHLKLLGGRRPVQKNSKNTGWKHPAFRGYADYMETDDFKRGIHQLEEMAAKQRTAYMCSEAVWWSCHRSMVSDFLKLNGWLVYHIMEVNKSTEHTYTQPAKIINGQLSYTEQTLL
ncbi:MAG TPA: DUF488 domain-containing protein [Parafilimonas sp.]|nr:DUF488 domain-containing protein [Parafilimonas sp.]